MSESKSAYDRILETAFENCRSRLIDLLDPKASCDSPIETIFYVALQMELGVGVREVRDLEMLEASERPWKMPRPDQRGVVLWLERQATVEKYRVDFLFFVLNKEGSYSSLVVECDGHDFHERTKQQAARDRARDRRLQQLGHKVFRFTGSELWRDPGSCVTDVLDWAVQEAL